jgi:glycosyltransferase involved in cell wall biosynthesis
MILAFELTWRGIAHAPGNSAMIQILAAACPGHRIRVHAERTHLEELQRDRRFAACAMVEAVPEKLPDAHGGHTQIVSLTRFRRELAIVAAAVRAVPAGEAGLIFLLSATSTQIWAAALVARLHARIAGIHILLHGNLNDAIGWRTRNPVLRRFDMASTLRSRLPASVRYIVHEPNIADRLARIMPRVAGITDTVLLASNQGDLPPDFQARSTLGDPIHVGFVGLGTYEKGFDVFLDVATRLSARHPGRFAFHIIGSVQAKFMAAAAAAPLAEPPETRGLPRAAFTGRLAQLHFVMLPYRPGYYELSASGGLIDALSWLRPVLATDVPLMRSFSAAYGDIGYICDDFATALEGIVTAMDQVRYAAQVEAMRRARAQRAPAALATGYRRTLQTGFPRFPLDAAA